jgi:hypothetical protein
MGGAVLLDVVKIACGMMTTSTMLAPILRLRT